MGATTPFQREILQGLPEELPAARPLDAAVSHAPKRPLPLSREEKQLALQNALRYFAVTQHAKLLPEFLQELNDTGRITMQRLRPSYPMQARPLHDYPCKTKQAGAIMLMIQNNLDPAVAQHPHELITYGGNGAVFQNWAQYLLTMRYLATMSEEQTLVVNSGHPLGLFPSQPEAPRLVVVNGLMVPNYSKPEDLSRGNALGVTQYGQMTAGSYMYIGPQGIVHGTTLTLLLAGRAKFKQASSLKGKLLVSSGLGGMSGAQAKAAVIAGAVGVIAEINRQAVEKRHAQGWVDEVYSDLFKLSKRLTTARQHGEAVSLAYHGNAVDLWEYLRDHDIAVDLGSDQTSLHNPYGGGYYPVELTLVEAQAMMAKNPSLFKQKVSESLKRQVAAINTLAERGMYFFDYGNAFLLEAGRAQADIKKPDGTYRYPSYVEELIGPHCFDFGFGPFRWVCTSNQSADLKLTDALASACIESYLAKAPAAIHQQLNDNLTWIRQAHSHHLVVGSQARILYADATLRLQIAHAFNQAIKEGKLSAPVVLGRDHHDVSGTDSPWRETANIRDGSRFTADMAVQNFVGDAFRGATWVSLHNGGGVGWGEAINGGFGLVVDGTLSAQRRLENMLYWDVHNGIARRSWARNPNAMQAIELAMKQEPRLQVTVPHLVDPKLLQTIA